MIGAADRPARLGLRSRLIAAFALGALGLSMAMGTVAYLAARHTLVVEQQGAALRQAYANAALLRNALAAQAPSISGEVSSLATGGATSSLLEVGGRWYSTSLSAGRSSVPSSLRQSVRRGQVATQTSSTSGSPVLGVGIPVRAVGASYFLLVDLSDTEHTLRVLLAALAAAAGITTILGALVGLLASRRTMRPLTEVADAAGAIAGGDLSARLPVDRRDPDLGALAGSFNAMVDQLAERIERDARFTSDVSHELRSPLTTLAASLEVLEAERASLPPRASEALELMGADIRRFQRLVADLLEIARLDASSSDLHLVEVPVAELVAHAVAGAAASLGLEAPRITVGPGADEAWVQVDKRRMERIIENLVANAAHHAGGATGVVVGLDGIPEQVQIRVDDAGPGIEPEERQRVFERFYRGGASGRRGSSEGSGLGLALVAEHVAMQGGSIEVADGPGQRGASFILRFPKVEAPR